jgi:maleylacetate reductase
MNIAKQVWRGRIKEAVAEAARLGMTNPLIITTSHQSDAGAALLELVKGSHGAGAAMHTPVSETEKALAFFRERKADYVICQ